MKNQFKEMKIEIYQCPECEQWIYSRTQRDMKYCECGALAVDGGHYEDNVLKCERMIGLLPIRHKIVTVEVTKEHLYSDWNESIDRFGVYK